MPCPCRGCSSRRPPRPCTRRTRTTDGVLLPCLSRRNGRGTEQRVVQFPRTSRSRRGMENFGGGDSFLVIRLFSVDVPDPLFWPPLRDRIYSGVGGQHRVVLVIVSVHSISADRVQV